MSYELDTLYDRFWNILSFSNYKAERLEILLSDAQTVFDDTEDAESLAFLKSVEMALQSEKGMI